MKKLLPEIKWLIHIHNIILASSVPFYLVYFFLVVPNLIPNNSIQTFKILQIFVVTCMLLVYLLTVVWFNKQLVGVKGMPTLSQKLKRYKTITLIKFLSLFLLIITVASVYILTQHIIFAILFGCVVLWFFSQRPHPILLGAHLGINKEDLFVIEWE